MKGPPLPEGSPTPRPGPAWIAVAVVIVGLAGLWVIGWATLLEGSAPRMPVISSHLLQIARDHLREWASIFVCLLGIATIVTVALIMRLHQRRSEQQRLRR